MGPGSTDIQPSSYIIAASAAAGPGTWAWTSPGVRPTVSLVSSSDDESTIVGITSSCMGSGPTSGGALLWLDCPGVDPIVMDPTSCGSLLWLLVATKDDVASDGVLVTAAGAAETNMLRPSRLQLRLI